MQSSLEGQPLQVVFVDQTDQNAPIVLAKSTFSFWPVFKDNDELTFRNSKEGIEQSFNILGDKSTHKVKKVHWTFTVIEFEEGGKVKNSDAMPILIVNLHKIKEVTPVSKAVVRSAFR